MLVSAAPYFPGAGARRHEPADTRDPAATPSGSRCVSGTPQGDEQIRKLWAQMNALKDSYEEPEASRLRTWRRSRPAPLIVHGDRDPLYPVELALEMYRAIPHSHLWVVPTAATAPSSEP